MFNSKPKKKSLIEEANELVEQSQGIKSVFVKMKTDLEDKNKALQGKADQITEAMDALKAAKSSIYHEESSNKGVIKQLDTILN
jgi:hypothetical protein